MKHAIRPLAATLGLAAGLFVSSCANMGAKAADGPEAMSDEAMMQRQMELGTPGPEHEALAKHVGTWEVHYKFRWNPSMRWTETVGTTHARMELDGRYLREDSSFTVEGMPLQGIHVLGYDKLAGEYISLWADSMSTWWVTSRGKQKPDGTIEMKGTMQDAAGTRPFRMVLKENADGSLSGEMYDTIPPHGEVLVMTHTAKRR